MRVVPGRRTLLIAYAVLFTFMGVMAVRRIYTLKTDFDGFWRAGRAVLDGNDPYQDIPGPDRDRLLIPSLRERDAEASGEEEGEGAGGATESAVKRYLPFFGLFMAPLALLPMDLACALWHVLSVLALLGSIRRALRLAGRDGDITCRAAVVTLAATGVFWVSSLTMGQIAIVTLWLSLAAADISRSRPWLGGALAGLATAIKVTPGIMAVYFLLKRRTRAAAGAGIAFLLCTALAIPVWGLPRTVALHRDWLSASAATTGVRFFEAGDSFRYANQSLHAFVARTFMNVNAGRSRKPFRVNVADVAPATAAWIVRLLQIPLGILFLVLCASRRRGTPVTLPEVGVALALTNFVAPVAWTFQIVFTLPALLALWERRADRESRGWLIAALVLQLGIALPATRALGALTWSSLAALLGAWRAGMRERASTPPVSAG